MPLRMKSTDNTVLIERQRGQMGKLAREYCLLIETALLLAIGMRRYRNNDGCLIRRLASESSKHQTTKPRGYVRFAFQLQYRSAQRSFIKPASTSGCECIVVTLTTANRASSVFTNTGSGKRAAFRAKRVSLSEQTSRVPTLRASDPVVARFDVSTAYRTRLRIKKGERRVIRCICDCEWRSHAIKRTFGKPKAAHYVTRTMRNSRLRVVRRGLFLFRRRQSSLI